MQSRFYNCMSTKLKIECLASLTYFWWGFFVWFFCLVFFNDNGSNSLVSVQKSCRHRLWQPCSLLHLTNDLPLFTSLTANSKDGTKSSARVCEFTLAQIKTRTRKECNYLIWLTPQIGWTGYAWKLNQKKCMFMWYLHCKISG